MLFLGSNSNIKHFKLEKKTLYTIVPLTGTLDGVEERLKALSQTCINVVANSNSAGGGAAFTQSDVTKDQNIAHSSEGASTSQANTPKKAINHLQKKQLVVHKLKAGAKADPGARSGRETTQESEDDSSSDSQSDYDVDGKDKKKERDKEKEKGKKQAKRRNEKNGKKRREGIQDQKEQNNDTTRAPVNQEELAYHPRRHKTYSGQGM